MAATRLWLQEPPGSPNCPAEFPNCINSGGYDSEKTPTCYDPKQFATFEQLLAYAGSRGEQLRQTATAAEAHSICSMVRTDFDNDPETPPGVSWQLVALVALVILFLISSRG